MGGWGRWMGGVVVALAVGLAPQARADEESPPEAPESEEDHERDPPETPPAETPPTENVPPADAAPSTEGAPDSAEEAAAEASIGVDLGDEAVPTDPAIYKQLLIEALENVREKSVARITERMAASQESKMDVISTILMGVGWLGLLLLLTPLVLGRKYPGKTGLLFKGGAAAAATFALSVWLFTSVVLLLRSVQGGLGEIANPQLAMVEGGVDGLIKNIDDLVVLAPHFLEVPLAQVATGEQDNLAVALLQNAAAFKEDARLFSNVAGWFRWMSDLFAYVPIALLLATVGLFFFNVRHLLKSIILMPARVAAGEGQLGGTVKTAFRSVWREVKATFALIGVLIVSTIGVGVVLSAAVGPAMEAFLLLFVQAALYVEVVPAASTGLVYASLGGALVFLVLNVVVVLAANILYIAKAQRVFRQKFHAAVPLKTHKRFFGKASLSLLWTFLVPPLFIVGAEPLVDFVQDQITGGRGANDLASLPWGPMMLSGPAILVFGFVLVFWLVRGFKALAFIARYPVPNTLIGSEPT